MINKDRLKNICADIGVELDAQALERFELFASMLVEKNKVLNLYTFSIIKYTKIDKSSA